MKRRLLIIVSVVIALAASIWWLTKPPSARGGDRVGRALIVDVQPVARRAMPLVLEAVGTVEAERSVEVRAQVSGILKQVSFTEGAHVRAGAPLFEIDPAQLVAAVEQAKATLARDRAQAENAQAQLDRLTPLMERDFITRGEYDQARASAIAAAATVTADQAALQKARIDLGYTRISAPIAGRTGNLALKPGNLVSANTLLVTINQTQPALVRFTVPQQQLSRVREHAQGEGIVVEARADSPAGNLLDTGKLVFIDNAVNAQTGTVLLKARLPNAKEMLLPGQFVGVRMILVTEPDRVVVPEAAVQAGQDGAFVYLLDVGKARMQPIEVDRQVGDEVVVAKGLAGGESVIVRFPRDLAPGAAVTTTAQAQATQAPAKKERRP